MHNSNLLDLLIYDVICTSDNSDLHISVKRVVISPRDCMPIVAIAEGSSFN